MIKKLNIAFIILCIILVFTACGKTPGDSTGAMGSANEELTSSAETTAASEAPTDPASDESEPPASVSDESKPTGNTGTSSQTAATSSKPKGTTSSPAPSGSASSSKPTEPPPTTSSKSTTSSTAPTNPAPAWECINRPDLAQQLFNTINDHRAANGVLRLTWTDRNAGFAYKQAWYNAVNNVPRKSVHTVDQIGTAGEGQYYGELGFDVYKISEIVPKAFSNWKNSAGHNANMLNSIYNRAGIAVIEIRSNGFIHGFVAIMDFDYIDDTHEEMPIVTQ